MIIGCITESQKLINDAVASEEKGGNVNMCKALEELEERGRQEGRLQGQVENKLKLILKKFIKISLLSKLLMNWKKMQMLYSFCMIL
ncbi:MAG: hypothetical protein ACLVI9_07665 [Anaerostipes hadrus]